MTQRYILSYSGGYSVVSAIDPDAGQHHTAYGFSPREAIENLRGQPEFQAWLQAAGLRPPLDSDFVMQPPERREPRRGHNHAGRPLLRLVAVDGLTIEQ